MTANAETPRERILALFQGERVDPIPVFSGMGNVTLHGLTPHKWRFADIHVDATKMATCAASTYQLFGFESVVVPFDMGIEAEALGCNINFYAHSDQEVLYPTIAEKLAIYLEELELKVPEDLRTAGRIPLVVEAIKKLKREVGSEAAVGSWVLGPFTLAGQILELDHFLKTSYKKQELVEELLSRLTEVLIDIVGLYREAGADFITVREMGATSDVLSPRFFKSLVLPQLQSIFTAIGPPNVLHICGDTNLVVELMAESNADAIAVDQKNDIARTVETVGDKVMVFGNLDPFNVLVTGTPEDIGLSVRSILDAGVNALWPGCDIWPSVPAENMHALMQSVMQ